MPQSRDLVLPIRQLLFVFCWLGVSDNGLSVVPNFVIYWASKMLSSSPPVFVDKVIVADPAPPGRSWPLAWIKTTTQLWLSLQMEFNVYSFRPNEGLELIEWVSQLKGSQVALLSMDFAIPSPAGISCVLKIFKFQLSYQNHSIWLRNSMENKPSPCLSQPINNKVTRAARVPWYWPNVSRPANGMVVWTSEKSLQLSLQRSA